MTEYLINKGAGVTLAELVDRSTGLVSADLLENRLRKTEQLGQVLFAGDFDVMMTPLHEGLDKQLSYAHCTFQHVLENNDVPLLGLIGQVAQSEIDRFHFNANNLTKMMHQAVLFAPVWGERPGDPAMCSFFHRPTLDVIRITKVVHRTGMRHNGIPRRVFTAHLVIDGPGASDVELRSPSADSYGIPPDIVSWYDAPREA